MYELLLISNVYELFFYYAQLLLFRDDVLVFLVFKLYSIELPASEPLIKYELLVNDLMFKHATVLRLLHVNDVMFKHATVFSLLLVNELLLMICELMVNELMI